jgi:hypothetical protein
VVLIDQSTEHSATLHRPDRQLYELGIVAGGTQIQGPVRPYGVVVRDVLGEHGAQVPLTEDEQAVGALRPRATYPAPLIVPNTCRMLLEMNQRGRSGEASVLVSGLSGHWPTN